MKSYLLIITIVASICTSYAQFNFTPSLFHPYEIDFIANSEEDAVGKIFIEKDRLLDSTFKLSKEFDFQFRLWQDGDMDRNSCVFIMTCNREKWSASYYHFNPHWQEDCKYGMVKEHVDSSKLIQLWQRLRQNNILTLTSETGEMRDKMVKYMIDTLNLDIPHASMVEFFDGYAYKFELIKPLKRRSFCYGNPEAIYKEYPYIKEYAQATMILYLIKRYLGLPLGSPFR